MEARFISKEHRGGNIWEFFFAPEKLLEYVAGQYVDVTIAGLKNDARGATRTFSLTSVPTDNFISFATFFPEDSSSFKKRLLGFKPNEIIKISESMGDLVLPRFASTPIVLISGGLGVASFVAMLRTCQENKLAHKVALFWALRDVNDKPNFAILNNFRFDHRQDFVSPERLTVAKILNEISEKSMVYVSGSQRFTESIVHELRTQGHPDTRLAFDYFTGYEDKL